MSLLSFDQAITLLAAFGGSVAGALVGAMSAYWLNQSRERRSEKRKQHQTINYLIYVLMDARNTLVEYRCNVLAPNKNNEMAWLNAPLNYSYEFVLAEFRESNLSFLSHSKHANLPMKVLLAFSNFRSLAHAIKQRDQLVIAARRALAEQFNEREEFPEELFGEIAGRDVEIYLKKFWEGINERVREQVDEIEALIQEAREASVQLFPFDDPDIGILAIKPIFEGSQQ